MERKLLPLWRKAKKGQLLSDKELHQLSELNRLQADYHQLLDNFKMHPELDREASTQILFDSWLTNQL